MPLRNGDHGYGLVTKALHWLTVALLLVQVPLGFAMDWDDSGRDDKLQEIAREQPEDAEDAREIEEGRREELAELREEERAATDDEQGLVPVHATLGVALLLVGLLRIGWRLTTPLPPWAEQLTPRDKVLATWTERALLTAMVLMPATGLVLLRSGDDDLLPAHVASHVLLYLAIALHLGLVLRRGTLRRMLSGRGTPVSASP